MTGGAAVSTADFGFYTVGTHTWYSRGGITITGPESVSVDGIGDALVLLDFRLVNNSSTPVSSEPSLVSLTVDGQAFGSSGQLTSNLDPGLVPPGATVDYRYVNDGYGVRLGDRARTPGPHKLAFNVRFPLTYKGQVTPFASPTFTVPGIYTAREFVPAPGDYPDEFAAKVSGRVTSADGGPISGATVTQVSNGWMGLRPLGPDAVEWPGSRPDVGSAVTDDQGRFELPVLAVSKYSGTAVSDLILRIAHPDRACDGATILANVAPGASAVIDVTLAGVRPAVTYHLAATGDDFGLQPYTVRTSADGKLAAATSFHCCTAGQIAAKSTVAVISMSGEIVFSKVIGVSSPALALSADGSRVAASTSPRPTSASVKDEHPSVAVVYDVATGKQVAKINIAAGASRESAMGVRSLALSADGKQLLIGDELGGLQMFNLAAPGTPVWRRDMHSHVRWIEMVDANAAIVSDGTGYLHRIAVDTGATAWSTYVGSWATALDTAAGRILVGTKQTGSVIAVVDAATGAIISSRPTEWRPLSLFLSDDGKRAYYITDGADVGTSSYDADTMAPLAWFTASGTRAVEIPNTDLMVWADTWSVTVATRTGQQLWSWRAPGADKGGIPEGWSNLNGLLLVSADGRTITAAFPDPAKPYLYRAYVLERDE